MTDQPYLDTSPQFSDEIRKTTCYMCACRCGIDVHIKNDKVAYIEGNKEPAGVHPSEWRWLNEPYDALIKNNDTISSLQEDVDSLLGF